MSDQIITPEGYQKLKDELEYLSTTKRREIAGRIQRAKDMGDLSENAEYSEAKDAQAFNDGRIAELKQKIKNVTVVEGNHNNKTIALGSTVKAKNGEKEKSFQIVSFNEADPLNGKISNESPLGQAFIGKVPGDTVAVNTPRGEQEYKILDIQ